MLQLAKIHPSIVLLARAMNQPAASLDMCEEFQRAAFSIVVRFVLGRVADETLGNQV